MYPRLLSVATTTGCAQLRWDRDRGVLCGHQPQPQPGTPQLHCYANRDTEPDSEPLGEELNIMEDKHLMSWGFWTGSPFDGGWLGVADNGGCQVSGGQGGVGGGGPQISRGGGHTRQGQLTQCVSPDHSAIILSNHSTKQILLCYCSREHRW